MALDLTQFQRHIAAIRSEVTAERYAISVTSFLRWVEKTFGQVELGRLPRDTLVQYTHALLDAHYQPGTIHSHLAGINRYFRWLAESHNVRLAEFHKVELPKPKRKVKDTLSPDMLYHYFQRAEDLDEPFRTAAMLLPCSGLRSQEMMSLPLEGLKKSPFTLKDGTVKDTLCLVFVGKGGHERTVPLLDDGVDVIWEYLRGWRRTSQNKTYMFPGRHSGYASTRALRHAIQKIRGSLKMEFTPHTMRRTYLTSLYRKGVDVTMLAKIAGHSDVQILIDHYLALDEQDVVNAVHSTGGRLAL